MLCMSVRAQKDPRMMTVEELSQYTKKKKMCVTPPLTGPKPSTRKDEGCCQEGHPSVE